MKMSNAEMTELYEKAHIAGIEALEAATPTAMIVGHEKGFMSGRIDYSKPTYHVAEGPCGFAWILVKPGTSRFARWLKANGLARSDSYYGGVSIWVRHGGQSIERKEAYARAFADVIRDAGIKSFAMSRMD